MEAENYGSMIKELRIIRLDVQTKEKLLKTLELWSK